MQDRVAQPRLYLSWTGPRWGTRDAYHLELASAILAGDKNSRLYERLVYREQIASDVEFGALPLEIAGLTYLELSANPGRLPGAPGGGRQRGTRALPQERAHGPANSSG